MGFAIAFPIGCAAAFVLVEGGTSLWLLMRGLSRDAPAALAERSHTRYDPELGWVNIPGLHLPDFYGPSRSLTINRQGFRGTRNVAMTVPSSKLRIVCSGDSFTFGFGVGDEDTWCARLEARAPRFESVNMGQGGYGVGQAYLWYARDGVFEHDVHVFAFIGGDFARLLADRFQGYGKPRLIVEGGELVVDNVPVPRTAYSVPWLVARRQVFSQLRVWQLVRDFRWGFADRAASAASEELPGLARRIFLALNRLNQRRGSRLLLVYVPMLGELHSTRNDPLRELVRRTAQGSGIAYLDLLEKLRARPERAAAELYIQSGEVDFPGAEGHFSRLGNDWMAQLVSDRIFEIASR
jgi:lysophospholipase L1-like esterase